jgi:NarL family two-component system sensor histidine kinase LiaS
LDSASRAGSWLLSLRQLRWELTFSYMLVTVVALLVLELILLGVGAAFLRSGAPGRLLASDFERVVAPRLAPHLEGSEPELGSLQEELLLVARETGARGEEPGLLDLTPEEGLLFVVGPDGRLLASVPAGERLLPGLEPLVGEALSGVDDPARLSGGGAGGRVLVAAPIRGEDGRLLGAVAGSARLPDLTRPVLLVLGASLIVLLVPAAVLGTIFGFLTAAPAVRRLQRLARASEAWSRGDFSVAVRDRSSDEIGQLCRDLNRMAEQLESLIRYRQDLATLEERNRVARDLHDSVKQQVFAASLQLAAARARMGRDHEAAGEHLAQAEQLVRQAQRELNVLIHEMRPAALEDRGLAAALRDYVRDWSGRAEIAADFRVRGEREVPLEVEQGVFRVAQEALANVARHSGARRVEIDLLYSQESLTLRVADDGRGFDPGRPGEGFGLVSMRERARRLGGGLGVESSPGGGTRVICTCPLPGREAQNGRER